MNDLLWLVNHPLQGNVAGISTSWNLDTLKGLESWLFVEIRRILTELLHLTELELGKLRWTRMDSDRASALELLPTIQEVLWPSEPHLSLSTLQRLNLEAPWGGAKPHFLHTFCRGEHRCIYRRSKVVLWPKIGCVRPTCRASQPCNLAGRTSFLLAPPLGIGYHEHRLCWTHRQNDFWKCANTWPARQGAVVGRLHLSSVEPMFVPHHFLVSYFLWLCLILDIMKICMDFGPYGAFPSFDVPKMVNQQNSWYSLVISIYLLYLEWNVGMLVVNICILWPPTPKHLEFCSSLSKRKELNHGDNSKNFSAITAQE
jgi:hypothetical protein